MLPDNAAAIGGSQESTAPAPAQPAPPHLDEVTPWEVVSAFAAAGWGLWSLAVPGQVDHGDHVWQVILVGVNVLLVAGIVFRISFCMHYEATHPPYIVRFPGEAPPAGASVLPVAVSSPLQKINDAVNQKHD